MNETELALTDLDQECGFFEGYTLQRFIIIATCSMVSTFGIAANALLVAVFWKSLPSSAYQGCLAMMDALICFTYLLLFGVDAGFVYLKIKMLYSLYHMYIVPIFYVAKVVQFTIPYILILTTLERYLWTTDEKSRRTFRGVMSDKFRSIATCILLMISLLIRLPVLFAVQVEEFENCPDYFRQKSVVPTQWAVNSHAYYVFDFHIITLVQTCAPFVVLLFLNFMIVLQLLVEKRENKFSAITPRRLQEFNSSKMSTAGPDIPENYVLLEVAAESIKETVIRRSGRGKREQLRNAVYTMLAIVMSYLVCNGIHLFLALLERWMPSVLYESEDQSQSNGFYIALSDTVSICYMATSAIRIFIYAKCNPKLRADIKTYLKRKDPKDLSYSSPQQIVQSQSQSS